MNFVEPLTFAAKHSDDVVVAHSRSGGVFTALSDIVLEADGVIYGCVLNEQFDAVHVRATTIEDRNKMRGSKYIQSKIGDCYKQAKADLENGKYVLFSGTSCQIAGLRCFLNKEYEKLLCVDIVCHGVPSPKVWHSYLDWLAKDKKIKQVDFRNKRDFGWTAHVETITTESGIINSEVYKNIFYGHCALRPSCYSCPYKSVHMPGDISIADFWGIENAAPDFDDDKGVSLILVQNDKGKIAFDRISHVLNYKETELEKSLQPPLKKPFDCPPERNKFWYDFARKDFSYIARVYGGKMNCFERIIKKICRRVKRLVIR